MSEPNLGPADPFTYHPFLMLLPVTGKLAKLEALSSSFYARLEKVQLAQSQTKGDPEAVRHIDAELNMLRGVLDWLSPR